MTAANSFQNLGICILLGTVLSFHATVERFGKEGGGPKREGLGGGATCIERRQNGKTVLRPTPLLREQRGAGETVARGKCPRVRMPSTR